MTELLHFYWLRKKYKLDILSITWLWVLVTNYQKNTWLFVLVTIYPSWIPQLAHCINQYELVLSWTASQTPRTFSLLWIWWGLWSSHGYGNGEGESKGIWRIKCIRLWTNQSCFSLEFLSRRSLHFVGMKVFFSRVWDGMWKVIFQQNMVHGLVTHD